MSNDFENWFRKYPVSSFPTNKSSFPGILTRLASEWSLYPMEQSENSAAESPEGGLAANGSCAPGGVPVTDQMLSQTLPFRLVC